MTIIRAICCTSQPAINLFYCTAMSAAEQLNGLFMGAPGKGGGRESVLYREERPFRFHALIRTRSSHMESNLNGRPSSQDPQWPTKVPLHAEFGRGFSMEWETLGAVRSHRQSMTPSLFLHYSRL